MDETGLASGKPGNRGLMRLWKACGYSWLGFQAAWRHEEAFRQELLASLVMMPLGWYLGNTAVERVLLCGVWLLVLVVELLNSAVEAVVDRFGPERHVLSGRAKDLGSSAVFVILLLAALTWGAILGERWF